MMRMTNHVVDGFSRHTHESVMSEDMENGTFQKSSRLEIDLTAS